MEIPTSIHDRMVPWIIRQEFEWRTIAYHRFGLNIWQTHQLLESGAFGLDAIAEQIGEIAVKFESADDLSIEELKSHKPILKKLASDEKGNHIFAIDKLTASFLRKATENRLKQHLEIQFHFYSILTIAIWGAFETYLLMLFEELYNQKPQLLKSDETVIIRDIVDNRSNVVEYLIEKQLDKMGRFTLREKLKYLSDRINFCFSPEIESQLSEFYLVRNIVAHNTGIVRDSLQPNIPKSLEIKDGELRVSKNFLKNMRPVQ